MKSTEAIAKRALEAIISGANLEYQPLQSNCECDFNLRYADGTLAAVEVTAAINEFHRRILARIYNKKNGGSIIQAKHCTQSWIIFPATDEIREIRRNADRYLANLEQEGVDHFFWVSARTPSTRKICRELRIAFGTALNSDGEPTIEIGRPIGAGAVGPRLAIKTGETMAWREDNRLKLGATTMAERHLVVYVPAGSLAWNALMSYEPPATLPRLPDEISKLWLIGRSESEDEFVVWRASTNEMWRSAKVQCAPESFDRIR